MHGSVRQVLFGCVSNDELSHVSESAEYVQVADARNSGLVTSNARHRIPCVDNPHHDVLE